MSEDNSTQPSARAPGRAADTAAVPPDNASSGEPVSPADVSTRPPENWERDVLEKLAFASLKEQRRARIWNHVFRAAFLIYLIALPLLYFPLDFWGGEEDEKHTALVDVSGVIAAGKPASADRIVGGLRAAFEDEQTAGVILRINSPGGSPVQAGYVNDEIRRLRKKYPDIALYAVVSDMAASGGYYIAVAADKIFADKASIVGSVGVLMNGFGFVGTMEKLGVERRLITAGENKALLDPFSPVRAKDVVHLKSVIEQVHQQFIDVVKSGRGDRLSDDPQLFSGLFWSGEESVRLGLVDALGSSSYVAREVIGAERIRDFTPRKGYLELITDRLGASIAQNIQFALDSTVPQLR